MLQAALKTQPWFAPNLDGHLLQRDVLSVFADGKQAQVPLLAGWNADEVRGGVVLGRDKPTAQTFPDDVRKRFGDQAEAVLKVYPAGSDAEALESAAALASDAFIGYSTWRWLEAHRKTGNAPVYRYSFDRKIPLEPDQMVNGVKATSADIGARHAGEIEYVFGALELSLPKVQWQEGDRKLVGRDDELLGGLREERRPERAGPAEVAFVRRRPAGAAPRRGDHGGARRPAGPLRDARRLRPEAARRALIRPRRAAGALS